MRVFILSFVAGVCWLQQRAALSDPADIGWLLALALVVLIGHSAVTRWRKSVVAGRHGDVALRAMCLTLAGVCAGIAWAAGFAQWRMNEALPTDMEGKDVLVTGVVAKLPELVEHGVRFEFDVESAPVGIPGKLRLGWYFPRGKPGDDGDGAGELSGPNALRAGSRWQFTVRLKRPHGPYNPHGFDAEAWLLERGIRATGYIRASAALTPRRIDERASGIFYAIETEREAIRQRFFQLIDATADIPATDVETLSPPRYAGVLVALAIGDQSSIPVAQWQVFARTGVTHLMSISGLHVTMLAALAYAMAALVWRFLVRSGGIPVRLLQNWPAQDVAAIVGVLAALAYCLLAGFAVPAQRTLYMLTTVAIARVLRRDVAVSRIVLLALFIVVLIDPWAVLSAGFWLSFGAVAALLFAAVSASRRGGKTPLPVFHRVRSGVREWAHSQWVVTIALLPVVLALFGQFSLVSPLANALAIPLISFVITPLALLAAIGADFLLLPTHTILLWVMPWLGALSSWNLAVWQQAAPPGWTVALGLLGGFWLLLPRGVSLRWTAALCLLPLLTWQAPRPPSGEAWVHVLDVGQGLSVHVQTAEHDLLFDAGPSYSSETDAGNRLIVPYLHALGIAELSALVISHGDSDHVGGAASVLAAIPVRRLIHSLSPDAPLLAGGNAIPPAGTCTAGETLDWDGVRLSWLYPIAGVSAGAAKGRRNASACVLRIDAAGYGVLLPSDIEADQESVLVRRHVSKEAGTYGSLAAEVLVAPHHGSRTSSTEPFLDAVAAQTVIFPVGYRNRFGHPKDDIVERYQRRGTAVARSDQDGAVTVRLTPSGVSVIRERSLRPRYWHEG